MRKLTCAFIGLGLIGGSIAKGFRRVYPDMTIMAYARRRETLEAAYADGIIDRMLNGIDDSLSTCDYIFLCTPVTLNETYLEAVRPYLSPSCILTDVGSVKGNIHEGIRRLGLEASFIGGHPMAGSEKSGYQHTSDRLMENAYYVLTPTPFSPENRVTELTELVKGIGAIPLILDEQKHDYVVAGISHLPHIIASSLVNLVKEKDTDDQIMRLVSAGGFKDITRIASSSPEMWQQICMENKNNLGLILTDYIDYLTEIKQKIHNGHSRFVYDLFEHSREYRNALPDKASGPIKKKYSIYCDIIDESGAIATIATILATHQISIKNIGIVHNREFDEGVLDIEFYDETAQKQASELLTKCQYTIYER